ncbi:hypothetical protein HWV62_32973 [Athelia sp. TMB]|nr:hypothetical protein HWV62_32973 [Athelia sp. TMB]
MGSPSDYNSALPSGSTPSFTNSLLGVGGTNATSQWPQVRSNANSDVDMGMPLLGWPQQSQLPLSNATQVQTSNPELALGQLLVMYPAVQTLYSKLIEANARTAQAHDTQDLLIKENVRLAKENTGLTNELRELLASRRFDSPPPTRNTSLAPSDSMSMAPPLTPHDSHLVHQPATRPAHYPVEVLWSLEDSKNDIDVGSSDGNMSRPAMSRVIRHANGNSIDDGEYSAIKATAHSIAYDLNQLPLPPGRSHLQGMPRTMRFYKNNMVQEWNRAVAEAESQQELLTLCSAHWKAEHVIKAALQAAHSATKPKAPGGNSTSTGKRSRSHSGATSGATSSKRSRSDSITNRAKQNLKLHIQVPITVATNNSASEVEPGGSATSAAESATEAKAALQTVKFAWKPLAKSAPEPALAVLQPTLVDPSYDNILYIILSEHPDLGNLTDAIDLLHALNANPSFTSEQPSSSFTEFLHRIETAIPAPTDDEDEIGQSWGHRQFTAGGLTCTSVLDTWANIGSPSFAYRLIAAALTMCRVSRWQCKTQLAITPTSYLSDSYLNETCRLLWLAWKAAGGPMVKGKGKESSGLVLPNSGPLNEDQQATDSETTAAVELRKALEAWTVPKLKKWMADHKLAVVQGAKKANLLDIICHHEILETPDPAILTSVDSRLHTLIKIVPFRRLSIRDYMDPAILTSSDNRLYTLIKTLLFRRPPT